MLKKFYTGKHTKIIIVVVMAATTTKIIAKKKGVKLKQIKLFKKTIKQNKSNNIMVHYCFIYYILQLNIEITKVTSEQWRATSIKITILIVGQLVKSSTRSFRVPTEQTNTLTSAFYRINSIFSLPLAISNGT